MIVKDIFKVIYSPIKAFESIAKKPDIKGPFIILALILVSAAIEQYVFASKVILTTRTPGNNEWTESISSSWNWTSNGIISLDNNTYVIGNYSVRSIVSNDTSIWMKITNIGLLNCSGDEGYKRMSFWINWTHQQGTFPSNSTLRLFSTTESRYFELSLANLISKTSGEWSIPAGIAVSSDSQEGWVPINSPSWGNITGLEFMLKWLPSDRANLTMNIDDLLFAKKPSSFLTAASLGDYIVVALVSTVIGFFLTWIVYVGSFFIVSAGFHQKVGSWRALFIVMGYAFAIAIAGVLVRAILYMGLPALSFPMNSWPPSTSADSIRASALEGQFWFSSAVYPLALVTNLGLDLWIVALCAVSMRTLGGLSWKRAAIFAAFAYFIKFFLFGGSMI
jgi:hypothetical protein